MVKRKHESCTTTVIASGGSELKQTNHITVSRIRPAENRTPSRALGRLDLIHRLLKIFVGLIFCHFSEVTTVRLIRFTYLVVNISVECAIRTLFGWPPASWEGCLGLFSSSDLLRPQLDWPRVSRELVRAHISNI